MNPPPPTEEAVKAAFAWAESPNDAKKRLHATSRLGPYREGCETNAERSAKILAAHARALQEENEMLRREWDRLNREQESDSRVQLARKGHGDALKQAAAWRGVAEKLGLALDNYQRHAEGCPCSKCASLSELAKLKGKKP